MGGNLGSENGITSIKQGKDREFNCITGHR